MNKFYRNNFVINAPKPLRGTHTILEIETKKHTLYEVSTFIKTETDSNRARTGIEFYLGRNAFGEYILNFEDNARYSRIFKFIGNGENFKIDFVSADEILVSYLIADFIEHDCTQIIDLTIK